MELSIRKLKEILLSTIGKDLLNEGFSFNKSSFKFTKKKLKNKIECWFFFYDYKPSWIEFTYCFYFFIDEINNECKRFFDYCGKAYLPGETMKLCEGDLHPLTRFQNLKYRIDFTHKISSFEKDHIEIDNSRNILKKEFLPKLHLYSNLSEFQDLILKEPAVLLNDGPVVAAIVAIKLRGKNELNKLVEYLKINLALETRDQTDIIKILIDNIMDYAEKYPYPVENGYKSIFNPEKKDKTKNDRIEFKIETTKDIFLKGYAGESDDKSSKN